jgi:hypothetical protein
MRTGYEPRTIKRKFRRKYKGEYRDYLLGIAQPEFYSPLVAHILSFFFFIENIN